LDGILELNATVLSLTAVDLVGSVFGIQAKCPNETVEYFTANHSVIFPKIALNTDCLGNLLREYGIAPSAISITYDPDKNTLTIVAEGDNLVLTKCTSDFFKRKQVSANPVGTYCGVYQTVAKVKVAIVSDTVASTSGSVYGEVFSCPSEAFTFSPETSSIDLPKINNKDDCLGQILSKFSIDSSHFSIVYDQEKNQLVVKGPNTGPNPEMVLPSCPASVLRRWKMFPLIKHKMEDITVA